MQRLRRIGVVDGLVWVDGGDATAYRVDPQSNRVIGSLRLPAGFRLAAVAQGSLWLANEAPRLQAADSPDEPMDELPPVEAAPVGG